jgi:hypothetical protein
MYFYNESVTDYGSQSIILAEKPRATNLDAKENLQLVVNKPKERENLGGVGGMQSRHDSLIRDCPAQHLSRS